MKYFLILLVLLSCAHPHGKNASNIHMHHQSHQQLISSFDDKSRDEWQRPYEVLKLIGPVKDKEVIDIGAGSGYFSRYFQQAGAKVVAADVDDKFLEHIKKNIKGIKLKKIQFDNPLMGKEQFDIAFTSNTYHHIDQRINYLKKIKEGLKPNGRFIVLDFKTNGLSKHSFGPPLKMRIPISQVVYELEEAGFGEIIVYPKSLEHQYLILGIKTGN